VRISFTLSPPLVPSVPEALKTDPFPVKSDQEVPMKTIPAEVIAVETQDGQYPRIRSNWSGKYRGSFNTLVFGKNKPFIGSCHDDGSPSRSGHFSEPRGSIPLRKDGISQKRCRRAGVLTSEMIMAVRPRYDRTRGCKLCCSALQLAVLWPRIFNVSLSCSTFNGFFRTVTGLT
jgi:hypothetical protein